MIKLLIGLGYVYGVISALFLCFLMITGELSEKRGCIEDKGYLVGIFWGCDELVLGPYAPMMGGRYSGYIYKAVTWPTIFFES
jgi:hypothetical protein